MAASSSTLRIQQSSHRLEQIAKLRSRGIAEHIDLPQLVVGGDQSAGKSSVLTGLTGIVFPQGDGLCTRHATEIILTHSEGITTISVEIIPHGSRSAEVKQQLSSFKRNINSFAELPHLIQEASTRMGLRSKDNPSGPSFGKDVLRIEHRGPVGLHLSVVDLPGLIANAAEDQTDQDVETVHNLVETYFQNPRAIILAVVQAGNDIANQGIIKKAKKVDPSGSRTVGIITKPDMVNSGTEGAIAMLARNEGTTRLNHGFFLLKNPAPKDLLRPLTFEQREKAEMSYFYARPYSVLNLNMERVGIVALRSFLQQLLDQHIEDELPKVKADIQAVIKTTQAQINALGHERSTIDQARQFLSRLAMQFHALIRAASNGDYHSVDVAFFNKRGDAGALTRLRAFVHGLNTEFSNTMRAHGKLLKLVAPANGENGDNGSNNEDTSATTYDGVMALRISYSASELNNYVLEVYQRTRGRELPGDYNHTFLAELFHNQSSLWERYAKVLLDQVMIALDACSTAVAQHLTPDDKVRRELLQRIDDSLSTMRSAAEDELAKLIEDKDGQPLTYNHYYTDNIQKIRHAALRDAVEVAGKVETQPDLIKHIEAMQKRVQVDMDVQACSQALEALEAYYKVARKAFVDNVCMQVIERHLLRKLPELFTPETVAAMSDEELMQMGGETERAIKKRKELEVMLNNLHGSLGDLMKRRRQ